MKNMALGGIGPSGIKPRSDQVQPSRKAKPAKTNFKTQLDSTIRNTDGLRFSNHAAKRMESRNMELTPERARRLVDAVDAASEKGARESLVLLDELAFVVSVKNRTIITACDTKGLKENVFTKIDSAIFG